MVHLLSPPTSSPIPNRHHSLSLRHSVTVSAILLDAKVNRENKNKTKKAWTKVVRVFGGGGEEMHEGYMVSPSFFFFSLFLVVCGVGVGVEERGFKPYVFVCL